MARWVLTATRDERPHQELAGLLVEAQAGDEIVVESPDLEKAALRALRVEGGAGVKIITDPAVVAEERARLAG